MTEQTIIPRDRTLDTIGIIPKIIYILYIVSPVLGGSSYFIAFLINIFCRGSCNQSERTHFENQISIFMWTVIWMIVGIITLPILVGFAIIALAYIYSLIKSISGLNSALKNDPIIIEKI